ncbi:DUF3088 domain-containing protein [Mesorhizobium sp. M0088]|uniref:DUF3088 domain-containing protein n=1 Tax=Mesorhizobium sp. M0088 TaxID=2956873 RepID=UPI003335888E
MTASEKAKLFLLKPDFEDAAYPEQRFFCRHCALVEGVLASFPKLLDRIEVNRVGFPRPRQAVIDLIGAENQALPVLVLAGGQQIEQASKVANGRKFVSGADAIIATLAELYGIPVPHP